VVRRVEYVEVGGANQKAYGDAPLPTTLTTYKFAALQKVFSNNRGQELEFNPPGVRELATAAAAVAALTDGRATPDNVTWTGFEFTRTLFARTDQPDAPPVVADSEVLTQLRLIIGLQSSAATVSNTSRAGAEVVVGRVRLADFLTPNDALYFEARQRAVSISDYDLRLTRLPPPSEPSV
jgi:hypothetical protein